MVSFNTKPLYTSYHKAGSLMQFLTENLSLELCMCFLHEVAFISPLPQIFCTVMAARH